MSRVRFCNYYRVSVALLLLAGCGGNEAPTNQAAINASVPAEQNGSEAAVAPGDAGEPFEVTADSGATHRLVEWRELPNGNREAITMRNAPARGSFARRQTQFVRREIDCETRQLQLRGEGETIEEARRSNVGPGFMSEPLRDSAARVVRDLVCAKPSRASTAAPASTASEDAANRAANP